jgi:hypothetical protein
MMLEAISVLQHCKHTFADNPDHTFKITTDK